LDRLVFQIAAACCDNKQRKDNEFAHRLFPRGMAFCS
jgi:hypothetical protein